MSVSFVAFRACTVLILKEYENLHVYFEDYVGRRLTNASGAFLELAPSSASSSDAFHNNMQCGSYRYVFPFMLLPYAWNAVFCSTE